MTSNTVLSEWPISLVSLDKNMSGKSTCMVPTSECVGCHCRGDCSPPCQNPSSLGLWSSCSPSWLILLHLPPLLVCLWLFFFLGLGGGCAEDGRLGRPVRETAWILLRWGSSLGFNGTETNAFLPPVASRSQVARSEPHTWPLPAFPDEARKFWIPGMTSSIRLILALPGVRPLEMVPVNIREEFRLFRCCWWVWLWLMMTQWFHQLYLINWRLGWWWRLMI